MATLPTPNSGRIGACLVIHSRHHCKRFVRMVADLRNALGGGVDCIFLIPSSSELSVEETSHLCRGMGVEPTRVEKVDDGYFDFSCYRHANRLFVAGGYDGALFVNDTLVPKHDSRYLRSSFTRQVTQSRQLHVGFPLLIGPYRQSEFSVGDGSMDEFVATFLFFLNASAMKIFSEVLDAMPAVHQALASPRLPHADAHGINPDLLRLCQVHALQVQGRYQSEQGGADRLGRKLTTAFCERALAGRIRSSGLIWYVASGLIGRLLVPIQAGWSRMLGPFLR